MTSTHTCFKIYVELFVCFLCICRLLTSLLTVKKISIFFQINLLSVCVRTCVRAWTYRIRCMPECICVHMHSHVKEGFLVHTEVGQMELLVCTCVRRCWQSKQALNIKSWCNTNKNDIFLFSSWHFSTVISLTWGPRERESREGATLSTLVRLHLWVAKIN